MDGDDQKHPVDDGEGSVLGTLGTLAFVLAWPLLILCLVGAVYVLYGMVMG